MPDIPAIANTLKHESQIYVVQKSFISVFYRLEDFLHQISTHLQHSFVIHIGIIKIARFIYMRRMGTIVNLKEKVYSKYALIITVSD